MREDNALILVTCDLIPLAVLKPKHRNGHHRRYLVTCDLIPLAVLKPAPLLRLEPSILGHM